MPNKFLFREASEEDSFDLAQMRWDCFQEQEISSSDKARFIQECASQIIHGLASGQWVCFVAEQNDIILAHVFCYKVSKLPHPQYFHDAFGYVTNVYTKPEHRNQGLGSELLARIKEWAVQQNFELLIVWPSEESKRFYEKSSFTQAEDIFSYSLRQE